MISNIASEIVEKGIILLSVLLMSFGTSAKNVRDFDINGITLSSKIEDVKKSRYCSHHRTFGEKFPQTVYCNQNPEFVDYKKTSEMRVKFDADMELTRVYKKIEFQREPDLMIIKAQLHKKYGNPRTTSKQTSLINTGTTDTMWCWGNCYVTPYFGQSKYWTGDNLMHLSEKRTKGDEAFFRVTYREDKKRKEYSLWLVLEDRFLESATNQKMKQDALKNLTQNKKASELDL